MNFYCGKAPIVLDSLLGLKEIKLKNGYIEATAKKLHGAEIRFDGVTVTGTANLMMAASLAEGVTTLTNVAKEPEICAFRLKFRDNICAQHKKNRRPSFTGTSE